jgi:hypothetical protein
MKRLALLLILAASATIANGQTVTQPGSPMEAMRTQAQHLNDSIRILADMAIGQDRDTVVALMNTIALFSANFRPLNELTTILPDMRDSQDAMRLSIQIVQDVDSALTSVESSIKTMNVAMTFVHSPAVLAEATKARDAMIVIRDQLRAIKPP